MHSHDEVRAFITRSHELTAKNPAQHFDGKKE